ncbi:ATP pyrophosphatase [Rothia mucilaginosa]|uniref:ATP pyrophosphatase n=1 Tax=Rothia mucilaginosa TaxID=43675 RepID=UPI003C7D2765
MINTIMLIFWGIYVAVIGYKVLRAVITYEMNRYKDKKLRAEGIYVVRLNRFEVVFWSVAALMFPVPMFIMHTGMDLGFHWFDIAAFIISPFFTRGLPGIRYWYVTVSLDGVEQVGDPFYPFTAIDKVVCKDNSDRERAASLHFYTKSGDEIVTLQPIYGNYRLPAITRFRIEKKRWPDMHNPSDRALVDGWTNRESIVYYYMRLQEASGLADSKKQAKGK